MEVTMTLESIRSSFDEKVRRGMFRPITRRLHADMVEDRSQEALALAYENYRRHALQGRILDDALLVHFARHRAEDLGRQIVPCDGVSRKTCVMDVRNYIDGKVELLRLDKIIQDRGEADMFGLAEAMANNPVKRIVSAIDLESWLAELPDDDRALLSMRMAGCGWTEIGAALCISGSSAWSRCRNLGRELSERAHLEVPGEESWEQN
jgi:DNA-directed RNA polymerase specialized sigma24 family protein